MDSSSKCNLNTLEEGLIFGTFMELLDHRFEAQQNKIALNFLKNGEIDPANQISLSYEQLWIQVQLIARALKKKYPTQSRILILCPAGNEFVLTFLGCLYAGMIAVPCSQPSRRERDWSRVYSIVTDCDASAVITNSDFFSDYSDKFTTDITVENIDDILGNQIALFNDDLNLIKSEIEKKPLETVSPDLIAFMQYTSGSTGNPKGVLISHANLIHNQRVLQTGLVTSIDSCYVSWLPLFHDMGLIGSLLQSLFVGATFNYMSPMAFLQKPFRWLQALSHFGGTVTGGPNFAYELCVNTVTDEQKKEIDLSRWVCASNGAEPIKATTLQRFASAFADCGYDARALTPCYGLAEGTLMVTCKEKDTHVIIRHLDGERLEQGQVVDLEESNANSKSFVGVGVVVGDQDVRIVNPDTLELCSPHSEGEIWVKGPSIGQGYWKNPEQNKETFGAHIAQSNEGPFLRTGDAGFMDKVGQLYISGRYKDMMIIHGRNLYPQDIEMACEDDVAALSKGCSAAFSLDVDGEERLVVLSEVKRTLLQKVDFDQLIKQMRLAIIKNFQINAHDIVLLNPGVLLKTTSGKVQRRLNKQAYAANTSMGIASYLMVEKQAG